MQAHLLRSSLFAALLMGASSQLHSASSQPFLNLEVSERDLALNEVVRVSFNTNPPDDPDSDIAGSLRRHLLLPQVQQHWRLVGEPDVAIHERMGDVAITLRLLPRRSGELSLPALPLAWLDGDRFADLGTVLVRPAIELGENDQALPPILAGPGRLRWGDDAATASAGIDAENISAEGTTLTIQSAPTLHLTVDSDRLLKATIVADVPLAAARGALIQRWGDPLQETGESITWIIGWLSISAEANQNDTTTISVVHEGVAAEVSAQRVREAVFAPLEGLTGGAATTPQPSTSQPAPSATTQPAASNDGDEGPDTADRQAEAEAQFDRLLNQGQ